MISLYDRDERGDSYETTKVRGERVPVESEDAQKGRSSGDWLTDRGCHIELRVTYHFVQLNG